jgi:hypothetical protein
MCLSDPIVAFSVTPKECGVLGRGDFHRDLELPQLLLALPVIGATVSQVRKHRGQ